MKIQKNNGITLVALVITIIVLLILAGITIATLTGKNGILSKANTASDESKKKEYEEIFKIVGNGLRADKIINSWDNKTYLDEFEKEIVKEEKMQGAEIIRKNDEIIRVITKEGYIYEITENEIKQKGVYDGVEPPALQASNVTFYLSPSGPTNKNVEVQIKTTIDKYDLEYSLDGSNWQEYTQKIVMTDNGAIYARLVDAKGLAGGTATKNITNIDREPPTVEFKYNIENPILGDDLKCILTIEEQNGGHGHYADYQWQKQQDDGTWKGVNSYITSWTLTIPTTTNMYFDNSWGSGTYRILLLIRDRLGNSNKLYSEPITVRTKTEIIENEISGAKNEDGTIDKEKLKEELNKIENIEGVPPTITDEKLPLVVKIDDNFFQINKDGTVRKCKGSRCVCFYYKLWKKLGTVRNYFSIQ